MEGVYGRNGQIVAAVAYALCLGAGFLIIEYAVDDDEGYLRVEYYHGFKRADGTFVNSQGHWRPVWAWLAPFATGFISHMFNAIFWKWYTKQVRFGCSPLRFFDAALGDGIYLFLFSQLFGMSEIFNQVFGVFVLNLVNAWNCWQSVFQYGLVRPDPPPGKPRVEHASKKLSFLERIKRKARTAFRRRPKKAADPPGVEMAAVGAEMSLEDRKLQLRVRIADEARRMFMSWFTFAALWANILYHVGEFMRFRAYGPLDGRPIALWLIIGTVFQFFTHQAVATLYAVGHDWAQSHRGVELVYWTTNLLFRITLIFPLLTEAMYRKNE